jgi:hypothetical protein
VKNTTAVGCNGRTTNKLINIMEPEVSLPRLQVPATCPCTRPPLFRSHQRISKSPRQTCLFRNKARCYGEELSAPRPTSKLDDHPLLVVRDCLFSIFTVTIEDRSSTPNLRTRNAVVTRKYLLFVKNVYFMISYIQNNNLDYVIMR